MTDLNTALFQGLRSVGSVSSVSASYAKVNLSKAGMPSGTVYGGVRYGLGEVAEFVLIEGERSAVFGRITEVKLPESERLSVEDEAGVGVDVHALAFVQLLATVSLRSLRVISGIESYPRLGDKVYSAPHSFIAKIPELMSIKDGEEHKAPEVSLRIGHIKNAPETAISITPEKLFGRHCAVLGATGGGKSYTVSRLIEESRKHNCKIILLDATGEYRDLKGDVEHCHLGTPFDTEPETSVGCSLPPSSFQEQDFMALFEPAGKVQGPKLRQAIRSLKLANLKPDLANNGIIEKVDKPKGPIQTAERECAKQLEDPKQEFDPTKLIDQLRHECLWPDKKDGWGKNQVTDTSIWGGENDSDYGYCLTMITRIGGIISSRAFKSVFTPSHNSLDQKIDRFISDENTSKVLCICLSGIETDFNAREVITNAIARHMLLRAREGLFRKQPSIVFLDEAHNFVGKSLGTEEYRSRLDAFEIIAKEGRKYGLNLCLATQRPRDIPEGVISQMGTLLVHRLSNDQDRQMVERACGEIDRSASSFLPNLQPGEVALLGVDFPIPMTIQISMPTTKPLSDGANFQKHWSATTEPAIET